MYWKNPPWKKCTFIMHRNGEIKQSHWTAVKFTLFFTLLNMEDLFGVCWVKHWAKLSRWKYVRHMQYMKGWVKISKILHKHWMKHNIMKTAVSKFCNMPEGYFFLQLLAKCLNLKFLIMKWTKLHVILSWQWLFGRGSLCLLASNMLCQTWKRWSISVKSTKSPLLYIH